MHEDMSMEASMREYTVTLPTTPRLFYVWFDKWIGDTNRRWGIGGTIVANAIYYQLTRPDYLNFIRQPLPHNISIFRFRTGSGLAPRITNTLWGSLSRPKPPPKRDPI